MKTNVIFLVFFVLFCVNSYAELDSLRSQRARPDSPGWKKNNPTVAESIVEIRDILSQLDEAYLQKLRPRDLSKARGMLNEITDILNRIEDTHNYESTPTPQPHHGHNACPENEVNSPNTMVMRPEAFSDLLTSLKREAFGSDKLKILKTASQSSYFLVDQLVQLVDLFSFSNEKINVVEIIYPVTVDRANAYKIYSAFSFPADKEKVEKIISSYK